MIMHLLSKIFLGKRKTGKEMNIEILNTLVILGEPSHFDFLMKIISKP